MPDASQIAAAQIPEPGSLNLDHLAHFLPDIDTASADLERLGFTLTPFSPQSHRLAPGGPLVPAGTGNRCVMLERGYLEFLTPTGESPVAAQLRAAIGRYVGVHLIAFGTAAPDVDHARIQKAGFEPIAPVALQRPIGTESGEALARFTVVRVPPGKMAEGRVQFCRHHTPELLWQRRWLEHPNRARALSAVLLCVADPVEAVQRYGRYTGLAPKRSDDAWRIETGRGSLIFVDPAVLERALGFVAPSVPYIAGYALQSEDLEVTRACVENRGFASGALDGRRLLVRLPETLGGIVIFEAAGCAPLELG